MKADIDIKWKSPNDRDFSSELKKNYVGSLRPNLDQRRVNEVLFHYNQKKCYFEGFGGNNGDELIRRGSKMAIEEAGLTLVSSIKEAEVIVYRGGGSMNDFAKDGPRMLESFILMAPGIPIVVLPQSFLFRDFDFGSLLSKAKAPIHLFARERRSLEVLLCMPPLEYVKIGLDHDMAFWLAESQAVQRLRSESKKNHILIVERLDVEGTSGNVAKPFPFPAIRDLFPQSLRHVVKRQLNQATRNRSAKSTYAKSMLDFATLNWPDIKGAPVYNADISDEGVTSFDNFCDIIANSTAVLTNRLHVGVLAALLGKRVVMREGSYHKITGIYDYSLSHLPESLLLR